MTHEREVLENITSYRAQAMDAQTVGERAQAEGMLGQALGKLQVAVEAYPDLKANQNFLSLQEELASTENRIAFSRQAYNDSVMSFNNKIEMFPSNIVAGMFNFKQEEFFEIEDSQEKAVPKVDFSL
jgi:LemA protein